MKAPLWTRLLVVLLPLAAACSGGQTNTVSPTPVPGQPVPTPTPTPTPSLVATLVGAGDIANCANDGGAHAEATARVIERSNYDAVFTAGDNAYFCGAEAEFRDCYNPRWGRFKSRTYPSPGNHEYECGSNGVPYFNYFGERAGPRGAGFYSYTLGNWHVISLNNYVSMAPGQEQYTWLAADLEQARNDRVRCSLAYWHQPLFTSGPSAGTSGFVRPIWDLLYQYGVEVVINGHDHLYERFGPQDVNGRRDPLGPVEYIVGSGGASLYDFRLTLPNSVFQRKAYGVLKLTLRDVGWDSVFIEAGTETPFDATSNNLCR